MMYAVNAFKVGRRKANLSIIEPNGRREMAGTSRFINSPPEPCASESQENHCIGIFRRPYDGI